MKQKLLNNFLLRAVMLVAVLWYAGVSPAVADGDIALSTTSVTISDFSAVGSSYITTATAKTIGGYSWTVYQCMNLGKYSGTTYNNLQMKKNEGTITSPTITSSNGFKVTVTYSSKAGLSLQIGSEDAVTGSTTTSNAQAGTGATVTATTTSTSTSFKLTAGNEVTYVSSIVIEPVAAPTPSFTLTATANPTAGGSVAVEGNKITATPATGYRVSTTNPYTVTSGTVTNVTQSGNVFTVTADADCTVQINFEAIPSYTITFSENGVTRTATVSEGEAIDFTAPATTPDGYTFAGWVESPIVGTQAAAPTFVESATGTEAKTYYAVYAVGTESNITATFDASDISNLTAVSGQSLTWKHNETGVVLKLSAGSRYTGSPNTFTVTGGTSNYFEVTTTGKLTSVVTEVTATNYGINSVESGATLDNSSTTQTVTFSSDKSSVKCYASSNQIRAKSITVNGTKQTLTDYCTTVSNLPKPTITFKQGGVAITELNSTSTAGEFAVAAVCSYEDEVLDVALTFKSTDENIAYYNTEDNEVWTLGEGTATITVTFAGNDDYQGATAELAVSVERGTITLAFPDDIPATINIEGGATYTATATPAVTGITYSSSDDAVVDVDENTGYILASAVGTATITATFAGNNEYKPAEASYTIKVVDPNVLSYTLTTEKIKAEGDGAGGYGSKTITDDNGKTWNAYAIKNQHSAATSSQHFLQIKKSDNSTQYYIQVPAYGTRITKLGMNVSGTSAAKGGTGFSGSLFFSSSNTTSAAGEGVAVATASSATNSLTIDCSSLNLNTGYITASAAVRIWDIEVTYEYKVAVGEALYTTHVTADAVCFDGVEAYIVKSVGSDAVSLEAITSAPANTPVIIKGDAAKTYSLATTASLAAVTGNLLLASDGTIAGDGSTIFALGNKDGVGFYLVGNGVTIPAGKAYLTVAAGSVKEFLGFDFGVTTGIETIAAGETPAYQTFTLAGQRVGQASRLRSGIYVVNGKKVLVK